MVYHHVEMFVQDFSSIRLPFLHRSRVLISRSLLLNTIQRIYLSCNNGAIMKPTLIECWFQNHNIRTIQNLTTLAANFIIAHSIDSSMRQLCFFFLDYPSDIINLNESYSNVIFS
eukprot:snap_masked-scaffold_12-processed-gene-9.30-mRNA-1 protein AED:1.00 eAED:1.00 QI:0/0/0/0/1/1/2/0/114